MSITSGTTLSAASFRSWLRQPKSLRLRLVGWNLLVLVLVLVILSIIIYQLVVERLNSQLEDRLNMQASELQFATQLKNFSFSTSSPNKSFDWSFFSSQVQNKQVNEFTADPLYIKFLDKDTGQTLLRSPSLDQERLPFNSADFNEARHGKSVLSTQVGENAQEVRVLTLPLYDNSQQLVTVAQVGQSLQTIEQIKNTLLTVLILRGLVAVILTYTVCYFLISRELRPLQLLVSTMQSLNIQQLSQGQLISHRPCSSEVELLTKAFNQMLVRLEDSFKSQRAFVADVSHELRTPLTAVRGQLEVMLLNPKLEARLRQNLQRLVAEVDRLGRLVANLLTNARAETGQLPHLYPKITQTVQLDNLLIEVLHQVRLLNPKVELRFGQLTQVSVSGDPDLLKQVLFNLMDNALTYTSPGGTVELALHKTKISPQIEVTVQVAGLTGKAEEWVVLSVSDNGPGIVETDLPHIFERHYRGANTGDGSRGKRGSGLGLYIASLIMKAHKGTIAVKSEPGKGSRFEIWLPLDPLEVQAGNTEQLHPGKARVNANPTVKF
jgi:signal transduction histidine kinase